MQTKEWNVTFADHAIRLVAAGNGAKLFVDGQLLDSTNDLYASAGEPTLVGSFGENDGYVIGAMVVPFDVPLAEIRINNQHVAGDLQLAAKA
jgi:hypothetical protein